MSKIITFSRQFPKGHPKAGLPTYFVERIWQSLYSTGLPISDSSILSTEWLNDEFERYCNPNHYIKPKRHTIRAGNRWKVADKFSPRVWSGKPYQSKMITIAPDIEIKKIWDIQISTFYNSPTVIINNCRMKYHEFTVLSKNDGLSTADMISWFSIHPKSKSKTLVGQVLCWDESVEY